MYPMKTNIELPISKQSTTSIQSQFQYHYSFNTITVALIVAIVSIILVSLSSLAVDGQEQSTAPKRRSSDNTSHVVSLPPCYQTPPLVRTVY